MKRAKLYRTNVFEGTIAMVHSMTITIWEIFIPRSNIIVNDAGGCFEEKAPRGPVDGTILDIELEDSFVHSCEKRIQSNNAFSGTLSLFDELKSKYESELKDNIVT